MMHTERSFQPRQPLLHDKETVQSAPPNEQAAELQTSLFFWDSKSGSHTSEGKSDSNVSRGTCEMLRGSLQDFPSPSTSRRAPQKKKEKVSVKISTSLKVKTRFTWEPQSVTVQSDSLTGLTNPQFQRAHAVKRES